jgi:hypothetical protein
VSNLNCAVSNLKVCGIAIFINFYSIFNQFNQFGWPNDLQFQLDCMYTLGWPNDCKGSRKPPKVQFCMKSNLKLCGIAIFVTFCHFFQFFVIFFNFLQFFAIFINFYQFSINQSINSINQLGGSNRDPGLEVWRPRLPVFQFQSMAKRLVIPIASSGPGGRVRFLNCPEPEFLGGLRPRVAPLKKRIGLIEKS